jgi:hypothetical protein
VTDNETARLIERKRREREDELLVLLLFLADTARRDTARMLAHGKSYRDVIATDLEPGINAISRTMALAHADAYRRFGLLSDEPMPRDAAGSLIVLAQLYEPQARESVQAMAQTLGNAVDATVAKFPDKSPKLLAKSAFDSAGYTKDKPHGLDMGAERSIVLASNVGMLRAAQQVGNAEGRGGAELPLQAIGLRHVSIIDPATTDICLDRHRLTLPADHYYWRWNVPPLHPRCRSAIIPVFGKYEADVILPSVAPAPGWGEMPSGFLTQFGLAA